MSDGVQVYPQTHTKAVIDDNGYTVESRLQAMQDEINQAQLEVGAVPSDLAPTENSTNWVTSGGLYNTLANLSEEFDESVTVKGDELFDINTTSAEASSAYITASVDTANNSVSFTTIRKENTTFALRIKLPNLTAGVKYRLKFDYTNDINTISSVVIKDSSNSSTLYRFPNITLPIGSGSFVEEFVCPAGAYFLAFNVNLNVSTGRVATFSNISVFTVDTIKEEIAKIEGTFNNTINDVWPSIGRRLYKPDSNAWIDGYAITAETGTPTANSGCSYCKVMLEGVDRIDVPMRQSTALTYGLTFFSSSGTVTGYHSESAATGTRFTYTVPDNTSYMLYQYSISVKADVYMIFYYDDLLEQSNGAIAVKNVPMEVGLIANSGALIGYNSRTDYQWNYYRNAGFIKVKEGNYSITCQNKGGTLRVFKYDNNRNYLSYIDETIISNTPIQIELSCKYIRFHISSSTDTFMPEVTISGDLDDNCFAKFGINPQATGSTLENFLVETWYQTMGGDNESTTSVQDEGELLKNRGLIQLPDNYDPDGKPTRLVIYCHGSGVVNDSGDDIGSPFTSSTTEFNSSSSGHVDPTVFLKEGYAVMDMDSKLYTNTVLSSTNKDCPTPRVINCYKSGYDYVLRNYNICKDGVMLCGRSMGGARVTQLLLSNIPVIACCLVGPYVGPSYIWNVAGRGDFLGDLNGFPSNLTWDTTASYITYDEWHTNIYDNYGKFMNSVGLLRAMNIPDKDSMFKETIEDGVVTSGFRMKRSGSGATLYNPWDEAVFEKWGAKYPCPIKIFLATDDSVAPWRSHGNVLYKCCEAGGTPVELRKFTTGGHFPEFAHKASSYTTRFGETLSNVSVVYIEMIRFFRRYEQFGG